MTASSIYKALLTVNVASLIRASRFGVRDVAKRLRKSYKTISPFGTIDSGLEPEPLIPCIVGNYCKGYGLEIGPGGYPRCDPERTVLLDKFPGRYGPVKVDIVSDASSIPVDDSSFDYLFSSHCLEHMPDTIGTLKEWLRVVKPGGRLILMLPHAGRTWERQRSLSTLEHHIHDHANKVDLYDFTDWDEFERALRLGQQSWIDDPDAQLPDGSIDKRRAAENGLIHYHAWHQGILVDVLKYIELNIEVVVEEVPERTDSFLVVASKPIPQESSSRTVDSSFSTVH